ncbi:MAG: hypothetical protein QOE85_1696, partial [Actinomycetota bacterium]|nr:hypothetical protein [Actinomycetota bacterium]
MKFSRPVVINTVLIAVIVVIAVAVLLVFNPFASKTASATTQLTGTVQQGVVSTSITAAGSIDPVNTANASFATSGTIKAIDVSLGATVKKGQVLGTLSTSDLQTAVSDATTALTRAEEDLSYSYTSLDSAETAANSTSSSSSSQSGGTSSVSSAQQAVNSQLDSVDQAKAALTTAQENLANATLKSPIAGVVVAINGSVGGTTSAGSSTSSGAASTGTGASSTGGASSTTSTTSSSSSSSSSSFMTIDDVSQYTVSAAIAEADIANVKVGQAATVTFPALATGTTSSAKVTAIAPTGTSSNSIVTYATTITLTDPPAGLRLGQTANVAITTEASAASALYVPAAAITTANGTSTVKVVKNGKTTSVTVKTGIVGDNGTEITSGLTNGETIVIGTVS